MSTNPSSHQYPKMDAILLAGVEEFAARAYADASTDRIASGCGISKGLLYHYFGTKKNLYLACVHHALDTLTQPTDPPPKDDFYQALFASMESKMQLCLEHPLETKLLNMASRESSQEVRADKDALIGQYVGRVQARSAQVMSSAASTLPLKRGDAALAVRGLTLYVSALINRYLVQYQDAPEAFFSRRDEIMNELKVDIDLMLYGICKEETV